SNSLLYMDTLTNNNQLTWSLTGPAGTAVNNLGFNSQADVLNLVAGGYVLEGGGSGGATGGHLFRPFKVNNAHDLTPGKQVNGQLNPGTETDLYKFTVNAGDQFQFTAQGFSGGSLNWRLEDPFGGNALGPQGFANVGPVTLNVAGTYTLAIEGSI